MAATSHPVTWLHVDGVPQKVLFECLNVALEVAEDLLVKVFY